MVLVIMILGWLVVRYGYVNELTFLPLLKQFNDRWAARIPDELLIHLLCTLRGSDDSAGTSTKNYRRWIVNFIITKTPIVTPIVQVGYY